MTNVSKCALAGALLLCACARSEPPGPVAGASPPTPATTMAVASTKRPASASAPQPSAAPPVASASAPSSPSAAPAASASADVDAGAPVDMSNKIKPELDSPQLSPHGKALLEAIAKDDPDIAKDFFFPREPFKPLKDVSDADKYWRQLYAVYKRDIHELHRKRRDWSDVSFESITIPTPPTWVKPGDEYNKIGYYRTFHVRLRYKIGDKRASIDIHTVISWQGEWYITHLEPIRK